MHKEVLLFGVRAVVVTSDRNPHEVPQPHIKAIIGLVRLLGAEVKCIRLSSECSEITYF